MTLVFVVHAVLFFTRTAPNFLHSDAATTILLTMETLTAKSPLVRNYYYVNGDYWIFGGQWIAGPLILLLGVAPKTLFATNAVALALEVLVLAWGFWTLDRSLLRAVFAAVVTFFSWSTVHMHFAYVELAYGVLTTCHFVVFILYARALAPRPEGEPPRARRRAAALAVTLFFLFGVQNPTRALAFELVPLLAGCLWRWDSPSSRAWRRRVALVTSGAWLVALLVHRLVLKPLVTSAVQVGMSLGLRPFGILHNLDLLLRGTLTMTAPRDDLPWSAVLGLAVVAGAVTLVIAFALRSRTYERTRFVAVVLLAEVAFVLCLFIVGDILGGPMTMRYLMPGLLPLIGLGCLVAARDVTDTEARGAGGELRWRRLAVGWLCLLPIVAGVATSRRVSGAREVYVEADPVKLQAVADELKRRDLRHGFATYWNANSLTLLSGGSAKTCGVAFRDGIIPRKWLVDTDCFLASRFPASIYVIAAPGEHDVATRALAAVTFPAPLDRFVVDGFEVRVFRTADCPVAWLDLVRPRI